MVVSVASALGILSGLSHVLLRVRPVPQLRRPEAGRLALAILASAGAGWSFGAACGAALALSFAVQEGGRAAAGQLAAATAGTSAGETFVALAGPGAAVVPMAAAFLLRDLLSPVLPAAAAIWTMWPLLAGLYGVVAAGREKPRLRPMARSGAALVFAVCLFTLTAHFTATPLSLAAPG